MGLKQTVPQQQMSELKTQLRTIIDQKLEDTVAVYYFNNIYQVLEDIPATEYNKQLYIAMIDLGDKLSEFYHGSDLSSDDYINRLQSLELSYETLLKLTHDNPVAEALKKPLRELASLIAGIILGILGMIYGAINGIIRSIFELKNPLRVGFESMLAGTIISFMAGKRLPENFFNNQQKEKIASTLNRLQYLHNNLKAHVSRNASTHTSPEQTNTKNEMLYTDAQLKEMVQNRIEQHLAPGQSFAEFCQTHQAIQVCTKHAAFGMQHLEGYLGHHTFIRVAIGNKILLPIEYGCPYKHSPAFVDQAEPIRVVSGETLFKMLVIHERMRHIQNFGTGFLLNQYKAGEYDCRSYVNQILEAVGLKRSKIRRFVKEIDAKTGTYVYQHALTDTCLFSQQELDTGAEQARIRTYTRRGFRAFLKQKLGNKQPSSLEEKISLQLEYTGFSHDQREMAIKMASLNNLMHGQVHAAVSKTALTA